MSRQSSYTVEYKLGLLRWYQDNGENMHATARHFGIDRKCLREWLEKADRFRDNQVGVAKAERRQGASVLGASPGSVTVLAGERVAASPYT